MRTKFYQESYRADEVCSLGCRHKVYYYRVVAVKLLHAARRTIDYGGTFVGSEDAWYADEEGMIYFRKATWDGPDWPKDENGEGWLPYPIGEVKKDLDGNLI